LNRVILILKSKTFWASVITAGGYLTQVTNIGFPEILTAVGIVLAGAGIKDNFIKLGRGDVS